MEGHGSFIYKIKNMHKLLVLVGDGSNGGADLSNAAGDSGPYLHTDRRRNPGRKQAVSTHRTQQRDSRNNGYQREEDMTSNTVLHPPGPLFKGFPRRISQRTIWRITQRTLLLSAVYYC